jgi:hypothetical protein
MLIRIDNDELVEYPDDLVAMMLAAPVVDDHGEYPTLSIEEFNCLVHGMLGMLAGQGHTLAQNIDNIREYCALMSSPDPANLEKARAQVKLYNETLTASEISNVDRETMHAVFPFQNQRGKTDDDNIIDQTPGHVKSLPAPDAAQG